MLKKGVYWNASVSKKQGEKLVVNNSKLSLSSISFIRGILSVPIFFISFTPQKKREGNIWFGLFSFFEYDDCDDDDCRDYDCEDD